MAKGNEMTVNEDGSDVDTGDGNNKETKGGSGERIEVIVGQSDYEIIRNEITAANYHTVLENVLKRVHQIEKMAVAGGQLNVALACVNMESKLFGLDSARAVGWMNQKMANVPVSTTASARLPEHDHDPRFATVVMGGISPHPLELSEQEGNTIDNIATVAHKDIKPTENKGDK